MDIIFLQHIDQLLECRRNIDSLLVHYAFDPLVQHFLYADRKVVSRLSFFHLV